MEIKKMQEYLRIAGDISSDKEWLLNSKYIENPETYFNFINNFYEMILGNGTYRVAIFEHHKKIMEVISKGKEIFVDKGILEEKEKIHILERIRKITEYLRADEYRMEMGNLKWKDVLRCEQALLNQLGSRFILRDVSATKIIEASQCYVDYSECPTYNLAEELIEDKKRFSKEALAKPNPYSGIKSLCGNRSFLYFANAMMSFSPDVDENFIDDVSNIVHAGLVFNKGNKSLSAKQYRQVAKVTKKNIRKYKKEKKKEEIRKKIICNIRHS